jgi:hypothetical protein
MIVTAVFFTFSLLAPAARAANVQVACPNGAPGAFPNINSALNSLNPNDANTITVSGTCVENLFVAHFSNLVIQPVAGQVATITSADPSGIVVQTFQSTVVLTGLIVQGGGTGILLNQSSSVNLANVIVQGNSGDGLDMQMGSTMVVESSTFQNNGGAGMSIGAGSNVTIATSPDEKIRVLHNGRDGIDVDSSFLGVNFGTLDVENNGGAALLQTGGRTTFLADISTTGGNLFQGNGEGLDILDSGSALFVGRNVIRSNGDAGVQVMGSSVRFEGAGVYPDGTPAITVVQGHNILGVNVIRMGEVTMNGPHQIQNNGSLVADPALRGGIRLNRASLALQNGVQVTGNTGPGIRADQNTGTSMSNVTISGNTEEGVHVDRQSVSGFSQPLLIGGNGGASISCDSTSLLFGDLTGVAGINCMRVEHAPGPARPGRVRQ